jgi:PAS domain S-box-containing protein
MLEAQLVSMKSPSLRRQKFVLRVAFLIIALLSSLAFYSTQRLIAASEQVERTQNMLVETHRFLSEIRAVESSSRGYFVTGDDRYLRVRADNLANIQRTGERLREVQVSGALRQRLDRIVALAAERLEYSNRVVSLRNSPADALQDMRLGSDIMDRLRGDAETIIATQTRAYRAEQLQLQQEAWLTSLALAVGVILSLGAIGWLFALRGREVEARRQLEEELRALNMELEDRVEERSAEVKRASDLLTAVVENLPDMILLKEPCGGGFRYLLVNAAGERLIGRDRSEILGKTERDLFPAEEAAQIVEANRAVAQSGQPRTFTDRKLTTTGGVRTVETRMVPIANGSGRTALILAIIRDVTNAKSMEEQLRQLQRIDAIGRLTGGVAHDFNNLLAIIHGNSELIRDQIEPGSEAADMIDDVVNAAGRGAELVRRLLAFARMQHLEPEPIDLAARLPDILALLGRSLGEKIDVRVKTAQRLWPAIVDPTQVDDALVNLAINARDAMPGGGTLTIETQNVSLDEDYAAHHVEVTPGDYVMLAVSDTGMGMAPDVIARAFEPFFTTKEEGKGTGLGLSQVFGWVKQSGGHIKIYSELGHGTTIKLYLPRARRQGEEKAAEPEVATPKGDETIFVVEDNPNVRRTVVRQLHDLGYRTIEAESGAEAMREIRSGAAFDLLLTDVVMPGGMTGYQLADELRAERPGARLLFTSGYTELAAASNHHAMKEALLSKPYRKQDLGRAVRLALDSPAGAEATECSSIQ